MFRCLKRSCEILDYKYFKYFPCRCKSLQPFLDFDYLCDSNNQSKISKNIASRKGVGNIKLVQDLKIKLSSLDKTSKDYDKVNEIFLNEALKIPNVTHPDIVEYGDEPKVIKYVGEKAVFAFEPRDFYEISKRLKLVRTEHLGNVCGRRSYYLLGDMARLEQALIYFTIKHLRNNGFAIMSVPDVLDRDIIESCGMNTRGDRTQVYSLDANLHGPDRCLSGTSEMALAGYFANRTFSIDELPQKVATVSRCYRAEVSSLAEEKGIYRVHQFTKVEMFALSKKEHSDSILSEFLNIEEELFSSLGLHMQILDMPPNELGAQAYRKYDIEAWMPGKKIYGEISSCSNCTDYQSRRLNIKYKNENQEEFVHTINGTACAVPRMLIALIETYQNNDGTISLPKPLQRYFGNRSKIEQQKGIPELRLIKNKR